MNGPPEAALRAHHDLHRLSLPDGSQVFGKAGMDGFPGLAPGLLPLLSSMSGLRGPLLDLTGSGGGAAFWYARRPKQEGALVLEASWAAYRCAQATAAERVQEGRVPRVAAGLPWDAVPGSARDVVLLPATDRGSARVLAEFRSSAAALAPEGTLWAAMHRDRGARGYERRLRDWFGEVEIVAREGPWRCLRAWGPRPGPSPELWRSFRAGDLELQSLPGVFAAGKADPGSARLLATVDLSSFLGSRLLDLGCGYGWLGLEAARRGALVTALDDDLAAVRSARRNAEQLGLAMEVHHSDLDGALAPALRFDVVLCNPPFHVGKGVRLALSEAFVATAHRLLVRGGEFWLVANRDLPYERWLGSWSSWELRFADGRFKVLRALR